MKLEEHTLYLPVITADHAAGRDSWDILEIPVNKSVVFTDHLPTSEELAELEPAIVQDALKILTASATQSEHEGLTRECPSMRLVAGREVSGLPILVDDFEIIGTTVVGRIVIEGTV